MGYGVTNWQPGNGSEPPKAPPTELDANSGHNELKCEPGSEDLAVL